MSIKKTIATICIAGIIVTVFTYAGMKLIHPDENLIFDTKNVSYTSPPITETPETSPAPNQNTVTSYSSVEDIIADVLDGVVGVSAATIKTDDVFKAKGVENWAVGSGAIVSDKGYIITNHHVVGSKPDLVKVTMANGRVYDAKVMWSDPALDLAVIKVNNLDLKPIKIGDAKACRVGQSVMAIGNPLGLQFQRTVTSGVISAVNRTISTEDENGNSVFMEDLLQTDASINPGNSGGPLINERGEVVGINTIKVSEAEGIGFAIPINIIKPIIESFEKTGSFTAPYFGVLAYDRSMAQYITQSFDQKIGIFVISVDPSSPASRMGIKKGDVITHINRVPVDTMMDFRVQVYSFAPGSEISVSYITDGSLYESKLTLGHR